MTFEAHISGFVLDVLMDGKAQNEWKNMFFTILSTNGLEMLGILMRRIEHTIVWI